MKNEQRRRMRTLRNSMTDFEVGEKSKLIVSHFTVMPEYKNSAVIMLYLSAKNEPDTLNLARIALNDGKKIVVPITNTADNTLSLSYIDGLNSLKVGAFGILEPIKTVPCGYDEIDAVVVPGLVFDKKGGRIGYGKGYYDRFFENTNAVRIAFCYDFQIVETAATEEHDVGMDIIVTESGVIYCGK